MMAHLEQQLSHVSQEQAFTPQQPAQAAGAAAGAAGATPAQAAGGMEQAPGDPGMGIPIWACYRDVQPLGMLQQHAAAQEFLGVPGRCRLCR